MSTDADARRDRIKRSRKQEKKSAKDYGGVTRPGSGAGWSAKNDVMSDEWLIEVKFTDNAKSYTVKLSDLRGVEINAVRIGRRAGLEFKLGGRDYVIVPKDDFIEYIVGE